MDGGIESAGDFATGALIARTLEPGAGEHGADGTGGLCLNCGTALLGAHCHRCGQTAHVHRSIGAIGHELLHGVVHFEGKLWRTLPMLVWRPGTLTRRYIAGERARFVSPMALFLFSIFIMFGVFSVMGIEPPAELGPPVQISQGIEKSQQAIDTQIAAAQAKRAKIASGTPEAEQLDHGIENLRQSRETLSRAPAIADSVRKNGVNSGWHWLDHGLEKWQKNPGLMAYKMQSSGYKFSWLLIPLSLPFMWLLFFWRRDVHLYDHAVFVTYSIGFMSLLFIGLTLASAAGVAGGTLSAIGSTIAIWHIYRQLREAYRLRRWSAVLRTIILLAFTLIVMILFLFCLLALGFG